MDNAQAARLGLTVGQFKHLKRIVNLTAMMQENVHNRPNAPEPSNLVEIYAKRHGLEVKWPGLYPVFVKDGQEIICDF